jgi:hypothetical protein
MPLEEAVCSALSKGLNYSVTPAVLHVEAVLCGVERVTTGALPEQTAEDDFLVVLNVQAVI